MEVCVEPFCDKLADCPRAGNAERLLQGGGHFFDVVGDFVLWDGVDSVEILVEGIGHPAAE